MEVHSPLHPSPPTQHNNTPITCGVRKTQNKSSVINRGGNRVHNLLIVKHHLSSPEAFQSQIQGKRVQILTDNTTPIFYLNKWRRYLIHCRRSGGGGAVPLCRHPASRLVQQSTTSATKYRRVPQRPRRGPRGL